MIVYTLEKFPKAELLSLTSNDCLGGQFTLTCSTISFKACAVWSGPTPSVNQLPKSVTLLWIDSGIMFEATHPTPDKAADATLLVVFLILLNQLILLYTNKKNLTQKQF